MNLEKLKAAIAAINANYDEESGNIKQQEATQSFREFEDLFAAITELSYGELMILLSEFAISANSKFSQKSHFFDTKFNEILSREIKPGQASLALADFMPVFEVIYQQRPRHFSQMIEFVSKELEKNPSPSELSPPNFSADFTMELPPEPLTPAHNFRVISGRTRSLDSRKDSGFFFSPVVASATKSLDPRMFSPVLEDSGSELSPNSDLERSAFYDIAQFMIYEAARQEGSVGLSKVIILLVNGGINVDWLQHNPTFSENIILSSLEGKPTLPEDEICAVLELAGFQAVQEINQVLDLLTFYLKGTDAAAGYQHISDNFEKLLDYFSQKNLVDSQDSGKKLEQFFKALPQQLFFNNHQKSVEALHNFLAKVKQAYGEEISEQKKAKFAAYIQKSINQIFSTSNRNGVYVDDLARFLHAMAIDDAEFSRIIDEKLQINLSEVFNSSARYTTARFEQISGSIIDRKSFIGALEESLLFFLCGSMTQAEDEEIAREKIKNYCQHHSFSSLLIYNISRQQQQQSRTIDYSELLDSWEKVSDFVKIKSDDSNLPEIVSSFKTSLRTDPEGYAKFARLLLRCNQEPDATAAIVIAPKIKIKIAADEEIELSKIGELSLIIRFFPDALTEENLKQIAKNPQLISSINTTLDYFNSTYVAKGSFNLFNRINEFVAAGEQKIAVEKLLSFEALTQRAASFEEGKKPLTDSIKTSVFFEFLSSDKSEFSEFYEMVKTLPNKDRQALKLFEIDEKTAAQVTNYIEQQKAILELELVEIQKNLVGKSRIKDRAAFIPKDEMVMLIDMLEDEEIPQVQKFKAVFERAGKSAAAPEISAIAQVIEDAAYTEMVKKNWPKFMSNKARLKERAALLETADEVRDMVSSALGLITQEQHCANNLAILLQRVGTQYQNPDEIAFSLALHKASWDFLNSDNDVIANTPDYAKIIQGEKNIYLPQKYFYVLIGEEMPQSQGKTFEEKAEVGQEVYQRIMQQNTKPIAQPQQVSQLMQSQQQQRPPL